IAHGFTVNFAESTETVFDNMREVSPHVFAGVPRIWEKIHSRLAIMRKEASWIGGVLFDWAVAAGHAAAAAREAGKSPGPFARLNHLAADLLVLSNLRALIGLSRARRATSGAAPIAPELIRWFAAIGVPLVEGFGMTE